MRDYFVVFKVFMHKDGQLINETTMNFSVRRDEPILNLEAVREIETELNKAVTETYPEFDISCVVTGWQRFE